MGDMSKCIDAGDMNDGTALKLWTCNGQPQQQFGYDGTMKTVYLSSSGSADASKCLDIKGGALEAGTLLEVWDCTGCWNQQFSAISPDSKTFSTTSSQVSNFHMQSSSCPPKPSPPTPRRRRWSPQTTQPPSSPRRRRWSPQTTQPPFSPRRRRWSPQTTQPFHPQTTQPYLPPNAIWYAYYRGDYGDCRRGSVDIINDLALNECVPCPIPLHVRHPSPLFANCPSGTDGGKSIRFLSFSGVQGPGVPSASMVGYNCSSVTFEVYGMANCEGGPIGGQRSLPLDDARESKDLCLRADPTGYQRAYCIYHNFNEANDLNATRSHRGALAAASRAAPAFSTHNRSTPYLFASLESSTEKLNSTLPALIMV